MASRKRAAIMAVASKGGHWEQLLILSEGFRSQDIIFVTTDESLLSQAQIKCGAVVSDCNRNQIFRSIKCVSQCMSLVLRTRPKIVISTGAAPGLLCLIMGRIIGAETIWVDSFANVERLSMSGKFAKHIASNWLTQWEHLSTPQGPSYVGQLL
jgi:UDP-N-acetylglucosamine:LPS N-acetylglucosamine transferase